MRLLHFILIGALFMAPSSIDGKTTKSSLVKSFLNPPDDAKPIMIWQWMDGLVNSNGITTDLEAYREAGIGGVQQFLVGGPMQTAIKDTANAIGTASWKELMAHAIRECGRLGLSFGTHNCPGWSSSAYPTVEPRYSMQKLVFTADTVNVLRPKRTTKVSLPQPESYQGFYRDISVLALPMNGAATTDDVIVLQRGKLSSIQQHFMLPKGGMPNVP